MSPCLKRVDVVSWWSTRRKVTSEVVRRAVAAGVMLVISTDSHHTTELRRMSYGVSNARRGWATAESVLNTLPREDFMERVGSGRRPR